MDGQWIETGQIKGNYIPNLTRGLSVHHNVFSACKMVATARFPGHRRGVARPLRSIRVRICHCLVRYIIPKKLPTWEKALGLGMILPGCALQPFDSYVVVLCRAAAGEIHQAETILGVGVALFRERLQLRKVAMESPGFDTDMALLSDCAPAGRAPHNASAMMTAGTTDPMSQFIAFRSPSRPHSSLAILNLGSSSYQDRSQLGCRVLPRRPRNGGAMPKSALKLGGGLGARDLTRYIRLHLLR